MKKIKFRNLSKQNKPLIKDFLKKFKQHLYKSDYINGKSVFDFENKFKEFTSSKYCISCANGSDALTISIKALGLKKNEEVITTSLSWIATSAAITNCGGRVVFCDIERDSFNIDPQLIEKKITNKTRGIIPVHLYGHPAKMKIIKKIAKKYNLWIIEDCAQAHGSKIDNVHVGNFGNFGTFSFFPGKNLGALGDAGCIITNNKKLAKKARLIANHGGKGLHLLEGVNSRLDLIQASFLLLKLKKLKLYTKTRIKNANIYYKYLSNLSLPVVEKNSISTFHQFVVRCKNRRKLIDFLVKNKIDVQIHYKRILPMFPAYSYMNLNKNDFRNSYNASNEILSLPVAEEIEPKNIKKICDLINDFYKK